jgi:hypothetical protein
MAHAKDLFERLPHDFHQLDRRSAANLLAVRRAVGDSRGTSLMVGAGVSASVGLPHWNRLVYLVAGTFFEHWISFHMSRDGDRDLTPPKELSIAGIVEDFWSDDVQQLANAAVQDPVLLIQQIKNCVRPIDWRYLLRKALYESSPEASDNSTLLGELVALVKTRNVLNIINYNYDDTLLRALRSADVHVAPLWAGGPSAPSGSVHEYHPHGLLARDGGPNTELIFAEAEYYQETAEPYSWGNLVQLQCMTSSTCIFVGLSMRDPNLRRLLRTASRSAAGWHFAILPRTNSPTGLVLDALFDQDLARLRVKVVRYDAGTSPNEHALVPMLIRYLRDESVIGRQKLTTR